MRKPQHWGLVTTLREQFQGGCDQFLVTGSVAMLLYGLAYQCDEPNDLDITMINPTPETIRILQALEAVNPLPNRPGYGSDELFRFTMQGRPGRRVRRKGARGRALVRLDSDQHADEDNPGQGEARQAEGHQVRVRARDPRGGPAKQHTKIIQET